MFGGLTKTSSRIAIAAALGMTLGGFVMSSHPAKAADLGGDCCADLEERVAELEATTVRKGNKKVSVTLSGWVVKYADWWDDGVESNFYVGDKHTTLSSHFQISGSATIAPGWSGGYTISVETRGGSTVGDANQFNDDTSQGNTYNIDILNNISVLLSYMWIKSDKWGTLNWGQLSQATDNVALLPDLSGTIIESNAVLFDGSFFFLRPKGFPKNAEGLVRAHLGWRYELLGSWWRPRCRLQRLSEQRRPLRLSDLVAGSACQAAMPRMTLWMWPSDTLPTGTTSKCRPHTALPRPLTKAAVRHAWFGAQHARKLLQPDGPWRRWCPLPGLRGGMPRSTRSAPRSCMSRQACSSMACIRGRRTTERPLPSTCPALARLTMRTKPTFGT